MKLSVVYQSTKGEKLVEKAPYPPPPLVVPLTLAGNGLDNHTLP